MPTFSAVDLAVWSGGRWDPAPPAGLLEGVSNDTRTIVPGNLYFALSGDNFDGHAFVEDAFRKGAGGAVVNDTAKLSVATDRPVLRVKDSAMALSVIAASYRTRLDPEMVAVTGSAGKSTVKEMTAQILASSMPVACTKGNWNNNIGLPLSILAMEQSTRIGVFEIGTNHPGELAPLCSILKPSLGIVTNVGPVHIEFFGSVEAIAEEKATLLRSLPVGGVAILNKDGGCFDFLRAAAPCRVLTVSLRQDADYVCVEHPPGEDKAVIRETKSGDSLSFNLCAPGEHNIMNAMLAIAVARRYGIGWSDIKGALESFSPLPMRWQREKVGGFEVINDAYNANPMSMRASIKAFAETATSGGKWLILAGMLELGADEKKEHVALGEFVAGGKWKGLITVGAPGNVIAAGAESAGFDRSALFRCETNEEAAAALSKNVSKGDVVLLKASRRMRLEQVVEKLKHTERA